MDRRLAVVDLVDEFFNLSGWHIDTAHAGQVSVDAWRVGHPVERTL